MLAFKKYVAFWLIPSQCVLEKYNGVRNLFEDFTAYPRYAFSTEETILHVGQLMKIRMQMEVKMNESENEKCLELGMPIAGGQRGQLPSSESTPNFLVCYFIAFILHCLAPLLLRAAYASVAILHLVKFIANVLRFDASLVAKIQQRLDLTPIT